jgi:hypothetical protein
MEQQYIFGFPAAAIGPLSAAIFAGAVALVGLIITKEQKTSEFRQAWIDALRGEIAEMLSHLNAIHEIRRLDLEDEKHWELAGKALIAANGALFRIRLRLNPKERASKLILRNLRQLELNFAQGVEPDRAEMARLERGVVRISQWLLKSEWKRVRRGELAFTITKWGLGTGLIIAFGAILVRFLATP